MSSTGTQLAVEAPNGVLPKGRSPLAHLVHALKQPLTALQCSLELAAFGPRRPEQFRRTLSQGLEFTDRMRVLIEAMSDLVDVQTSQGQDFKPLLLDVILRDTARDLLPVAEAKGVLLALTCEMSLPVRGDRRHLVTFMFRLLESALSLTPACGELRVFATPKRGQACLSISWTPGPALKHSPFSPPELGLLIAQAGWENAGGQWHAQRTDDQQSCTIQMPLAFDGRSTQGDWEI